MTDHGDVVGFLPDRSYVIPGRLVRQLLQAAEPAPEPTDMEKLITFLSAAKIRYNWEMQTCGDSGTAQVWFRPMGSWELVFEFESETGKYTGMYLEA